MVSAAESLDHGGTHGQDGHEGEQNGVGDCPGTDAEGVEMEFRNGDKDQPDQTVKCPGHERSAGNRAIRPHEERAISVMQAGGNIHDGSLSAVDT
ncbi:MAG: hypothetical protein ACD_75C01534G0003, partial [uncultured bacterium]